MKQEPAFTHCHECDRGGLGNAEHKCACGWRVTKPEHYGCYLGTPIVGESRQPPKRTRSQERYQRYIDAAECFDSFIDFCRYDAAQQKKGAFA
jgi:hypothetical protein